jgi:hypothetical protein
MRKQSIQNLVHRQPGWEASIEEARKALGYRHDLEAAECWQWYAGAKHAQVRAASEKAVNDLQAPPALVHYWQRCFYADYQPDDTRSYASILSPPFLVIPCPGVSLGRRWQKSLDKGKRLWRRHDLGHAGPIISWLRWEDHALEAGRTALAAVGELGLSAAYALPWLCCLLPEGTKWAAERCLILTRADGLPPKN